MASLATAGGTLILAVSTITRFALMPVPEGPRLAATSRHWNLDRSDPR